MLAPVTSKSRGVLQHLAWRPGCSCTSRSGQTPSFELCKAANAHAGALHIGHTPLSGLNNVFPIYASSLPRDLNTTCAIQGNSDLYGLGIRIGVYTQLLSTIITNHFLPSDVAGTSTANLIFLCALLLALTRSISATAADFHVVECFVILQLILTFFFTRTEGGLFLSVEGFTALLDGRFPPQVFQALVDGEAWPIVHFSRYFSTLGQAYSDTTPLRDTAQRSLGLATAVINFWFWIRGSQTLAKEADGCQTFVFFFGPLVLGHSIRVLFALIAGFYLIRHGLVFIVHIASNVNGDWKVWGSSLFEPRSRFERRAEGDATETALAEARQTRRSAISARLLLCLHGVLLSWSFVIILYTILAVEVTLVENNVEGVYEVGSTGQFIPLLIGILGLARALVSAVFDRRLPIRQRGIDRASIARDGTSAVFQYRIDDERRIVFDARAPAERQSLDDMREGRAEPKIVKTKAHPLAPPRPPSEESIRTGMPVWRSGRFLYTDRRGNQHVFHKGKPRRRQSWDGVATITMPQSRPHRARTALMTPLQAREDAERTESRRWEWFEWKDRQLEHQLSRPANAQRQLQKLRVRWQRFHQGVDISTWDAPRCDEDAVWLPADVTNDTLFCMEEGHRRGRHQRREEPPSVPARSVSRDRSGATPAPSIMLSRAGLVFGHTYYAWGERANESIRSLPRTIEPDTSRSRADADSTSSPVSRTTNRSRTSFDRTPPSVSRRTDSRPGFSIYSDRSFLDDRSTDFVADATSSSSTSLPLEAMAALASQNADPESTQPSPTGEQLEQSWSALSWLRKLAAILCKSLWMLCNAFCLCGLCVWCWKGTRKLNRYRETVSMEQTMHRTHKEPPTIQQTMLYQCQTCDEPFYQQSQTRQWRRIHIPPPDTASGGWKERFLDNVGRLYDFSGPSHTKKALKASMRALVRVLLWSELGREVERALVARVAAYQVELEETLPTRGAREAGQSV